MRSLRKLGGQVALQLIVKVAPQTRVAAAMNTVTLRLREEEDVEHNIKHAEAEDHAEFRFDLNNPQWDVWEARYERAGPASTPILIRRADAGGGPVKAANFKLDTDVLYIRTVEWNTTTKLPTDLDGAGPRPTSVLLGHNGEHQVTLHEVNAEQTNVFLFDKKIMEQDRWESLPYAAAPTLHQVGNLVIKSVSTSNGTSDYFKFDPDSDEDALAHPTVTFEIEDAGDKHRYQWWLWAKPTLDEPNSIAFTGIMESDGKQIIVINSTNPQGYRQGEKQDITKPQAHPYQPLTAWGTYTFELRIKEVEKNSELGVGEPLVDLRSQKLSISQHGYEVRMNEDDGEMKAFVSYTLQSERAASKGKVAFLDATMKEKTSVPMQLQLGNPQKDVELYTFGDNEKTSDTQQDATYRAIFTATDDFAKEYRDHKNRDVVVNAKDEVPTFHAEDDWMPGPQLTKPSNVPNYYNGPYQPQVGGVRPRRAFFQAGWLLATRVNSPKQVDPLFCREVPSKEFTSFNDSVGFSSSHFDYIKSRNGRDISILGLHYRYIHVLGCRVISYDVPVNSNEVADAWGRSSLPNRMTWIGVGEILSSYSGSVNWDAVQKVTIHELGHQFLPSGRHDHGYDNPRTSVVEGEATAEEVALYKRAETDPQALKQLKLFRTFSAQAGQPAANRDSYLLCVMNPVIDDFMDWRFCGHHRELISNYKWPNRAD